VSSEKAYANNGNDNSGSDTIVVSLGDSYSSGEGCEPFYGQDGSEKEKAVNHDFLAHRSEKAWPGLLTVPSLSQNAPTGQCVSIQLSEYRDNNWFFAAVSGAETKHVYKSTQEKRYARKLVFNPPAVDLPHQLKVISQNNLHDKVNIVTMTIGGNDLGFGDVIETAVKDLRGVRGGSLYKRVDKALELYNSEVAGRLETTYREVQQSAGVQAAIVVAGYPALINVNGSGGVFSKYEAWKINSGIATINARIDTLITKLRVNDKQKLNIYFVCVMDYFDGKEAYTADPFINPIYYFAKDQDLTSGVSQYSMHPNRFGQEAYAEAVQKQIDILLGAKTPSSGIQATSLVFDVSGSMDEFAGASGMSKLQAARDQARGFVHGMRSLANYSGHSADVGIVSFASDARVEHSLSSDYSSLEHSINSLSTWGLTNIAAGMNLGIQQLEGSDGDKVMLLLSDGYDNMSSYGEIMQAAQDAKDRGIKIYTVGFGLPGDLDTDLLQEIATLTGGSYSYQDSTNLIHASVGLFGDMIYNQLAVDHDILADEMGDVAQDETVQAATLAVTENGSLQTFLYWPGSELVLELHDPSGTVVKEGYPGYTIDDSSIPILATVENARQGEWTLFVHGKEVSMPREPYYLISAFQQSPIRAAVGGGGGMGTDNGGMLMGLLVAVAIMGVAGAVYLSRNRNKQVTPEEIFNKKSQQ